MIKEIKEMSEEQFEAYALNEKITREIERYENEKFIETIDSAIEDTHNSNLKEFTSVNKNVLKNMICERIYSVCTEYFSIIEEDNFKKDISIMVDEMVNAEFIRPAYINDENNIYLIQNFLYLIKSVNANNASEILRNFINFKSQKLSTKIPLKYMNILIEYFNSYERIGFSNENPVISVPSDFLLLEFHQKLISKISVPINDIKALIEAINSILLPISEEELEEILNSSMSILQAKRVMNYALVGRAEYEGKYLVEGWRGIYDNPQSSNLTKLLNYLNQKISKKYSEEESKVKYEKTIQIFKKFIINMPYFYRVTSDFADQLQKLISIFVENEIEPTEPDYEIKRKELSEYLLNKFDIEQVISEIKRNIQNIRENISNSNTRKK